MKKEEKKPRKKVWRIILAILCVLIAVPVVAVSVYSASLTHKSHSTRETTTVQPTEYLDIETDDIKKAVGGKVSETPLKSAVNGETLKKALAEKAEISFAKYYDIDTGLKRMKSTKLKKKMNDEVLDENENVDADKLYEIVLRNNEEAKDPKNRDTYNTFYADAEPQEIREICNLTAKTVNETKADRDIHETAAVLSRLKVFRHNTTTDLAAVTQGIVFYFNPNMIDLNKKALSISGRNNKDYDDKVLTFVHEIEHIKQYGSSDDDRENGMKAGFCRRYDDAEVNSLWNQWVLEAGAEMKMMEYLNTDPMVYAKKISYVKSYYLATLFEPEVAFNALINATFDNDLDATYQRLKLKSKKEQRDFLNLLYSIQICQYDCDDFWDYYAKQTGKTLTDEERAGLRMDIRTEAIYNLTDKYYRGILTAMENKTVRDLETVFYLLKVWELDCNTHLVYLDKASFLHAKDFVIWLNARNRQLFRALADSTGIDAKEIERRYAQYRPKTEQDGKEVANYRFYGLEAQRAQFIDTCFNGYVVAHYAPIAEVAAYAESEK